MGCPSKALVQPMIGELERELRSVGHALDPRVTTDAKLLPLVYRLLGGKWLLIVTVGGTTVIPLVILFTDSGAALE